VELLDAFSHHLTHLRENGACHKEGIPMSLEKDPPQTESEQISSAHLSPESETTLIAKDTPLQRAVVSDQAQAAVVTTTADELTTHVSIEPPVTPAPRETSEAGIFPPPPASEFANGASLSAMDSKRENTSSLLPSETVRDAVALQSVVPGPIAPTSSKRKQSRLTRVLMILLVVVLLSGGSGIAALVYSANQPRPFISLTSRYVLGSTPVGATDTTFQVNGQHFPAHAKITFLLDGAVVPGSSAGQSDSHGTITSQLSVTAAWSTGKHTLTAKDATVNGVSLLIVAPGQDKTPGPHSAPTDSASGAITVTIQGPGSGFDPFGGMQWSIDIPPAKMDLVVKGTPDGGSVCGSEDDGKKYSHTYPASQGYPAYVETSSATCSGTYRGGHLTYTETFTSYLLKDSLGSVCSPKNSVLVNHLEGSFGAPESLTGFFGEAPMCFTAFRRKGIPLSPRTSFLR
jgi:hypothetical protein